MRHQSLVQDLGGQGSLNFWAAAGPGPGRRCRRYPGFLQLGVAASSLSPRLTMSVPNGGNYANGVGRLVQEDAGARDLLIAADANVRNMKALEAAPRAAAPRPGWV